jgi:hypothetical protein
VLRLEQAPEALVPQVAHLCYHEWPLNNQDMGLFSPADYEADMRKNFMSGAPLGPFVLVALDESQGAEGESPAGASGSASAESDSASRAGRFLGTVALAHHDMPSRPDLFPWVISLLVVPEARGQVRPLA